MGNDEAQIRKLVDTWMLATKNNDLETVLKLMADDVVFMVPGQEPFGKEQFAVLSKNMEGYRIDGTSEVQEIQVLGEWAWMRNRIRVTITQSSAAPIKRSGYTLTILKKKPDGDWVITRDANLVTGERRK